MVARVFVGAGLGFLYPVSVLFGGSSGRPGSKDRGNGDEPSQGCSSWRAGRLTGRKFWD